MKAVVITSWGDPGVLHLTERADPLFKDDEVLIAVHAAGVNRPDIFQRRGNYPAPNGVVPDIPGLEVAGTIVKVGKKVDDWKEGDKVCCLVAGGGYATRVAVAAKMCLPIPKGFTLAEAAALPETVYTVWDNVFRRGGLKAGQSLLVHGGAGGIGSTCIQLAKAFGAQVFTTAGSEEKADFCSMLGADKVVNYKKEDFSEILKGEEIHVILDIIGGDYFGKNMDLLTEDGRLVYINAMQGHKVVLDIMKMMRKRISLTGSTLRNRDMSFKIQLTEEIRARLWPVISDFFRPQVREIPIEEVVKAHRLLENGDVLGKIVLTIG